MCQKYPVSIAVLRSTPAESGSMQINYYLQSRTVEGDEPHQGYGVAAELYKRGRLLDQCVVEDVTSVKAKALTFIEMLARNGVTPVTLRDVAEDFVSL